MKHISDFVSEMSVRLDTRRVSKKLTSLALPNKNKKVVGNMVVYLIDDQKYTLTLSQLNELDALLIEYDYTVCIQCNKEKLCIVCIPLDEAMDYEQIVESIDEEDEETNKEDEEIDEEDEEIDKEDEEIDEETKQQPKKLKGFALQKWLKENKDSNNEVFNNE